MEPSDPPNLSPNLAATSRPIPITFPPLVSDTLR